MLLYDMEHTLTYRRSTAQFCHSCTYISFLFFFQNFKKLVHISMIQYDIISQILSSPQLTKSLAYKILVVLPSLLFPFGKSTKHLLYLTHPTSPHFINIDAVSLCQYPFHFCLDPTRVGRRKTSQFNLIIHRC